MEHHASAWCPRVDGSRSRARRSSIRSAGEMSPRDRRRQEWVAKIPVLHMGNRSIERTLRRSYDDLGALRIEDPDHPERIVVAAGAPWFMALFGRDSLWASLMALPVDPSLALGTLQTLADRQGSVVDPDERGGTGQDPARGQARRLQRTGAGRQVRLLRQRRRHAAVRDGARGGQPLGIRRGDHRRPAAPCGPGAGLDPGLRGQGRRRVRRV